MGRCFIIQPFDKAKFDKRCKDTFQPAIRKAGLDPYRIDEDPSVVIPIERIQAEIRDSQACFAEITTNNPNVWFELGYALALGRPTLLVCCTSERTDQYPFDVRHRSVLNYTSESARDFEHLASEITTRLKAIVTEEVDLQSVSVAPETAGLTSHEMTTLVVIMQNQLDPDDGVGTHIIESEVERTGFTKLALSLSLRSLVARDMISRGSNTNDWNNSYTTYSVRPAGEQWLQRNLDNLKLRVEKRDPAKKSTPPSDGLDFENRASVHDNIPF